MRPLSLSLCVGLFLCLPAVADEKAEKSGKITGLGPAGPVVRLHTNFKFTEGPAADRAGNVYFTDIPNQKIHRVDLKGKLTLFRDKTRHANGLMVNAKGE